MTAEPEYHRPDSLDAAQAITDQSAHPVYIAGGQDLTLRLRRGELTAVSDIISLEGIADLYGISRRDDVLRIGAMETHDTVANSDVVKLTIPALADLAQSIGDQQIRIRGTIGGAIMAGIDHADSHAALLGLGAILTSSEGEITSADFLSGESQRRASSSSVLLSVDIPIPQGAVFLKHANRAGGYSEVALFLARMADNCRQGAIIGDVIKPEFIDETDIAALANDAGSELNDRLVSRLGSYRSARLKSFIDDALGALCANAAP